LVLPGQASNQAGAPTNARFHLQRSSQGFGSLGCASQAEMTLPGKVHPTFGRFKSNAIIFHFKTSVFAIPFKAHHHLAGLSVTDDVG
jgi:hypothetical protein